MYEIATLKTKKLPELQEIAKKIGVKRIAGLKKLDLIYQIVDYIASKPEEDTAAKSPEKPKKEETMDSREFWLFIGSMVFLLSSLQITISTSMPVFNKLFGPEGLIHLYENNKTISNPIDHYNSFQVPFAIVLTVLVSIGQYLTYRKTNMPTFYKKLAASAGISVILTIAFAWYSGMTNPIYILLLFTSTFAIVANIKL